MAQEGQVRHARQEPRIDLHALAYLFIRSVAVPWARRRGGPDWSRGMLLVVVLPREQLKSTVPISEVDELAGLGDKLVCCT